MHAGHSAGRRRPAPVVTAGGRVSFEQRYYITTLGEAKLVQRAVRSHWGIENGLHWRLDESQIRRGNAPHNVGVIRQMAMNLLKREKKKISYRKKRIRVAVHAPVGLARVMGLR